MLITSDRNKLGIISDKQFSFATTICKKSWDGWHMEYKIRIIHNS